MRAIVREARMILALPLACALAAAPMQAQIGTLRPVDQADHDPSFLTFRQHMLVALVQRDSAFLVSHVDPRVDLDFGGGHGLELFHERWAPGDPRSEIWTLLAEMLGGGGRYWAGEVDPESGEVLSEPEFHAPDLPLPEGLDAFEHVLVMGEGVHVRTSPALDGEVIAHVSFTALPLERYQGPNPMGENDWVRVRLADGRVGFVHSGYAKSAIGYRTRWVKRDGRWWLAMLLAGD